MADLTGVAEYSEKMERLETTTPGHADAWNIRHQLLLNNDAFLKREKERLEQALNEYYEQLVAYADKVVADLIDGAPTTMDTLEKLSDAINANKNIQEALDAAIGTKANQSELNTLSGNLTKHKTSTDHDGRYYTEVEIDGKVGTLNTSLANHKASADHDGRYYTEAEIDTKISTLNNNLATQIGQINSDLADQNPNGIKVIYKTVEVYLNNTSQQNVGNLSYITDGKVNKNNLVGLSAVALSGNVVANPYLGGDNLYINTIENYAINFIASVMFFYID